MGEIARDWFKSSLSTGANNCVETRVHADGSVDVRNSKNPTGPSVSFTRDEWAAFLGGVALGEFDAA
jgi:hypothetical protein